MQYRQIGNTDLVTSVIGLGCEGLDGKSPQEVKAMIDTALDAGINYIDMFMPQPEIRSNLGKALKGRRDKVIIQGHLCTVYEDGQYNRTRDLDKIKESFEDLLVRLDTDCIDVGMIHFVDSENGFNNVFNSEIYEYAKELKEKGVIKYIGMSSHNPEIALKAVLAGYIDVLMFSVNPAFDFEDIECNIYEQIDFKGFEDGKDAEVDSLRSELFIECSSRGVGITVMKAFAGGRLLSDEQSPFGKALTPVQCIEYALSRPGVVNVLPGCVSVEETEQCLAYLNATPEEKDYSEIFSCGEKFTVAVTGRCMYCNHCKPCASNIDIAAVTKYLDIALMHDEPPKSVVAHYNELEFNATDCIECGKCETRCPFGVKITENMRRAQRVFK